MISTLHHNGKKLFLYAIIFLCSLGSFSQGKELKYYKSRENKTCKAVGVAPFQGIFKTLACTNKKAGIKCENDKFCPTGQKCLCHNTCEEFRCRVPVATESTKACRSDGDCQNDGVCDTKRGGCNCTDAFIGLKCEQYKTDHCDSNPCKNGGVCKNFATDFSCNCSETKYTGKLCEVLDVCKDKKCTINATCHNVNDTALCKCHKAGWTGANCETDVNECNFKDICPNGNCTNHSGGFKCHCDMGFEGERCELKTNFCKNVTCLNGGSCTSDTSGFKCNCQMKFGGDYCEKEIKGCTKGDCDPHGTCKKNDTIDMSTCQCTDGWYGVNCENRYFCPSQPCQNGGTCSEKGMSYQCTCPLGFIGTDCETNKDECINIDCNNGSCVDGVNTYKCSCYPGYTGVKCEIEINECFPNPCMNGGTCLDEINDFKCMCDDKLYYGKRCEKSEVCKSNPCVNGVCMPVTRTEYKCNCSDNFGGKFCEKKLNNCPYNDCHKSFDGATCNKKCSIPECNFDNGDCSLGLTDPWENCTMKDHCYKVFGDGRCNPECNIPLCLNDGGDCNPIKNCTSDFVCLKQYNNSLCDETCNTVECGFDGDDCQDANAPVPGNLIFVVEATPESFEKEKKAFVRTFNKILNSHLTVDKVEVIGANSSSSSPSSSSPSSRARRSLSSAPQLRVTTSLRNSDSCGSTCFQTTEQAANFLAGKASKGTLNSPLPLKSISSTKGRSKPGPGIPMSPIIIAALSIGIPMAVLFLVIAGYKRVKRGATWLPEGHHYQNKKQKPNLRHDPVGQEDELTSLKRDSVDESLGSADSASGSSPGSVREQCKVDPMWVPHLPDRRIPMESPDGSISTASSPMENMNNATAVAYHFHSPPFNAPESFHNAARYDKYEVALRLLEFNMDINAVDREGRSALHLAINALSDKVFQLLVRNRKCHIDLQANDGCTPLMDACRVSAFKFVNDLISTGAKVNLVDKFGNTALHHCAKVDNSRSIQSLLKNGAKVDAQNARGETALFVAAREGSYSCAETLLHHFYSNAAISDNMDVTPLKIATEKGHRDIIQLITANCSHPSPTPSPVSPDILPKGYQQQQYRFEPARPAKQARRNKRKSSKKETTRNIQQAALPYQYPLQMEPMFKDIYNDISDSIREFPDKMNNHEQTNLNEIQATIFDIPYLTPEWSPQQIDMSSPQSCLGYTPEYQTTSPESGHSVC